MSLIIEIMGGRGVGKSTVISAVKEIYPACISREGFRKLDNGLNVDYFEGFIENEKQYLRREIEDLKRFHDYDGIVLLSRGPTDVLMYMNFILEYCHPEWKGGIDLLEDEIQELNLLCPENRIYFKTSENVLMQNVNNDIVKKRKNMDFGWRLILIK